MSNSNSPKPTSIQNIARSNSATSKVLKVPPPSAALTAEEFRLAFSEIQNAQKQCKSLCVSLNKMFNELKNSVDAFSSQLAEIRSENTSLKSDITFLQERLSTLESSAKKDTQLPELLNEISEREKCLYNIVVHGLPDSLETSPSSRAADDIKKFNEAIHPISMSIPSESKLFRLGRPNKDKPRPLKIIFPSKEQAFSFIIEFNTSKRSVGSDNLLQSINISRDRTLLERQEIRRVYQELDSRKKKGEHNISIRYRNGAPHIMSSDHPSDGPARSSSHASKNLV